MLRDTTFQITDSSVSASLQVGGYLDGENTLTKNPYTKVFEPMMQIRMANTGDKKIVHPQLVFNNRGRWFTVGQMRTECFNGAATEKDKALSLWKFFRDNRVHDYAPQWTDDVNDPVKLIGVYGYGMCYNTNYSMCFLAAPFLANTYRGYSPQGLHYVSELDFGSGYAHLDSDIETFYLKGDNITLAGSKEAFTDRHLIRRTHHYGKLPIANSNETGDYVANIYYKDDQSYFFGYMKDTNIHSLNFSLRPGESITYDWTLAQKRHGSVRPVDFFSSHKDPAAMVTQPDLIRNRLARQRKKDSVSILTSAKEQVSANGYFDYKVGSVNVPLSEILNYYSNLAMAGLQDAGPLFYIEEPGEPAEAIVKVESPFVIVDGYVKGKFLRSAPSDTIKLFVSTDSVAWVEAHVISGIGSVQDSVSLNSFVGSQLSALYKYYLKWVLAGEDEKSCGIDALEIHTEFQVSSFFLPRLQLGANTIQYSDASSTGRNIQIDIKWKESTANIPPSQIIGPSFPLENAHVSQLKFQFVWPTPPDDNGDEIVNYEFQLSDRSDMKFPLSSTFEKYIGNIDDPTTPGAFMIPEAGLLNDSTTYYWRVRAKDSRGAWGPWSEVWSFIPHGVMPPKGLSVDFPDDSLRISWQKNDGESPAYYEIHGSNEWLGFSPSSQTLIDTSPFTQFKAKASIENKLFYRVVAVGYNGEKSGPSETLELPYPHGQIEADTVDPAQIYFLDDEPTPLFYTRVDPVMACITTRSDSFSANILSAPSWLSLAGSQFSGYADSAVCFSLLADTSRGRVTAEYTSFLTNASRALTFHLQSNYQNSIPVISPMNPVVIAGVPYRDTLVISDRDLPHGDSIQSVSSSHPDWMVMGYYQNKIIVSGTPSLSDIGDTVISFSATDLIGGTGVQTHSLTITAPLNTSSASHLSPAQAAVSSDDLIILPNPFVSSFSILLAEEIPSGAIHIYNMLGELVYEESIQQQSPGRKEINAGSFPQGLYHLYIRTTEKQWHAGIQKVE